MTLKHGQAEMSKGEFYDDIWDAAIFWGQDGAEEIQEQVEVPTGLVGPNGQPLTRTETRTRMQYSPEAQEIRRNLIIQSSTWSQGDPGAHQRLEELLGAMGVNDEERTKVMSGYREGAGANLAAAAAAAAGEAGAGGGEPAPPI